MSLELEYGNIFEALAWARAAGDEALRVAAHRLGRTGKVARLSEAGLAALEEALGEAAAGLRSRPVLGQAPWRGESVYGMVDLDLTRKLAIAAGVADEHRAQREELPQGARERLAAKFATMACVDGRVPPSGRPLQKGTRLYVVPTQVLAYRLDVAPLDDGRTRIAWAGAQAGDESASFVIDARRRDTPVWLRRDGAADAVFAGDMATWSRLVCPGLRDAGSYEERPVGPALPPFEDGDTAAARGWIEGLDAGLRAAAEALLERTPDARWCRLSASQLRVLDELGLGLSDRGAALLGALLGPCRPLYDPELGDEYDDEHLFAPSYAFGGGPRLVAGRRGVELVVGTAKSSLTAGETSVTILLTPWGRDSLQLNASSVDLRGLYKFLAQLSLEPVY
jgi:hypothetical protein